MFNRSFIRETYILMLLYYFLYQGKCKTTVIKIFFKCKKKVRMNKIKHGSNAVSCCFRLFLCTGKELIINVILLHSCYLGHSVK